MHLIKVSSIHLFQIARWANSSFFRGFSSITFLFLDRYKNGLHICNPGLKLRIWTFRENPWRYAICIKEAPYGERFKVKIDHSRKQFPSFSDRKIIRSYLRVHGKLLSKQVILKYIWHINCICAVFFEVVLLFLIISSYVLTTTFCGNDWNRHFRQTAERVF